MSNRREVLQMGVAVTVLPLDVSAWTAPSVDAGWGKPIALYKAVFDTRFAASRAFGERMTARGIDTAEMNGGDMTALWFDTFYPQWQKGAAPIAGLTARGPLFCLERLAWDHGMRVIFRAEHSASSSGAVRHEIEAADVVVDAVRRAADGDWVSVVSDVILRHPHTPAPSASLQVQTARPAFEVPQDEILYSWVIAPVLRS